MFREKCIVCDSEDIVEIINLGSHPFADTFIPPQQTHEPDKIYPLICDLCNKCTHVQARCETNPEDRYSNINYSYTSSNSSFTRNHWEEFEDEISKSLNLPKNSFIVEAGSNDGYLIEQFAKKGNKVIGVDPSPQMAILAKQRGITTITSLFNESTAEKILKEHGKADIVIANNVFNHSNHPLEFAKAAEKILNSNGYFIFEQPYWFELVKARDFTQIYHEHVNYYSIKSLSNLLEKAGLAIKSVQIVNFHGKSVRVIAQKKEKILEVPEQVRKMIKEEESFGLFNSEKYKEFMRENKTKRSKFMQKIYQIQESGTPIIAIAAAAKGNTFLNYYKLDKTLIDYVTDASPHKKGKYTPATRIPITGDEIFSKYGKVYAIILTGNLPSKIKEILLGINPQIEFLVPEDF
ncbi:MAG: class I SAM-dependent methyltransferase [Candidatus Pacearchaeota archaeon]|nr:class I SAM-dependent methyltransferase [Candidatus Pacearchaeota archaeon]